MASDSAVNLIVAALDLQLVRLLRGAMNAPGTAAAATGGAVATPADRYEPRHTLDPAPQVQPRTTLHPSAHIDAQPVAAPIGTCVETTVEVPVSVPVAKEHPVLPPPWKTLPPVRPLHIEPKLKVLVQRPDVIHKGSLLDFFI